MVEHTCMKEMQTEIKKLYELIEQNMQYQRAETTHVEEASRLCMDSFQLALETFMQNSQTSNNDDSNSNANGHSTSQPPFQVRNLKLNFSCSMAPM